MKIITFANSQPQSILIEQQLLTRLKADQFELVRDSSQADYVITIGGDGTLLSAFHHFQPYLDQVTFIGIHTGHLGFYTDWQAKDIARLIENLHLLRQGTIERQVITYPLLQAEVIEVGGSRQTLLALNELSLRSFEGTMTCQIYISQQFFETFRGDGLCIATPSGSTGLNKSLGGAVIHPRLDALQLTEMASLNNRVYRTLSSPIIIAKEESFTLKPDAHKAIALCVDNRPMQHLQVMHIQVGVAKQRIRFANIGHNQFWQRVENSFIGSKEASDIQGDKGWLN